MKLPELIQDQPIAIHGPLPQTPILRIADDSRQVQPGTLFVARPGHAGDGRQFIADALQRGASAVLTDQPPAAATNVPWLQSDRPAQAGLALAQRLHGHPGNHLKLVGITGTNGKTTVAFLVRHMLGQLGSRCGMIGTIEIDDGQTASPASLTTPGAIELVEWLGRMHQNRCSHVVMEVSSHALDQGRTDGLPFAAAVFTNLSGDHLDYHGSMEAYAQAKAKLFQSLGPEAMAIVNQDDPHAATMTAACSASVCKFGFHANADCRIHIDQTTIRHTDCRFEGPWGTLNIRLPLIGKHNAANVAAALCVTHRLGHGPLEEAAAQCPQIPGRLERIDVETMPPFDVYVDYAHTDDALANVLGTLKPLTKGRLRVLFGCGGDRDRTKRPRMAKVACDLADDVWITSDNPRTEDPQSIIDDVLEGATDTQPTVVVDRAEAIKQIIQTSGAEDVVLIAGKGHEDYQIIGTDRIDFDDRVMARRALGSC